MADTFFLLPLSFSFRLHSLLADAQKRDLPPGKQTRQLPRAASCKHRMICHPHLINWWHNLGWFLGGVGIGWKSGTGMPWQFFRQWGKLLQAVPRRHTRARMVGFGSWLTMCRLSKRVHLDHSLHGTFQGSTAPSPFQLCWPICSLTLGELQKG